jgi:sugar porter (SP) family MFS transporter
VRAAGRKAAIIAAGAAFLLGVGVTAGAVHVAMLVVGRLAIGVGIGLANTAVPIYLSEIAPTQARGLINILFQLATTGSILAAQLVNLALLPGRHAWRASVGLAIVPALGLTFGTLFLDDSPASLAARGRDGAGRAALQRLRGRGVDVAREWAVVQAAHATAQPAGWAQWRALGAARVRPELLVAVGVALGSQLNGINACLFFAAPVFSALVAPGRAALLSAVAIGFALFAPTLVAAALVDRVGRRPLLLIGGCVMFVAQVALAGVLGAGIGPGAGSVLSPGAARAALALMCAFVTAFALSWGPGGWLVPSEVFPLDVRAAGQAAATCANFLAVFVTTQTFLPSMCAMRYGIYLASAAAVALMTLGVFFFLPETRGVHIESMDALWASHPVWRRWAAAKNVHGGGAVVSVGSPVQRRAKMSDDGGALG